MLAIRMQRLGRKALPMYRLAVQESHRHPSSGRVVAYVGNYNPHTKAVKLNKDKLEFYLKNGARPTPRVVRVLKSEQVAMPAWIKDATEKKTAAKHPEKLRRNQAAVEVPAAETPKAEETPAPEAEV